MRFAGIGRHVRICDACVLLLLRGAPIAEKDLARWHGGETA
ncbi:MAG: hypothetical protein QJR08_03685 [Bacillota bacterium]|nr:hypothetical protein [Bacillota bacterium]